MRVQMKKIVHVKKEGNNIIMIMENGDELVFKNFSELLETIEKLLEYGLRAINHKTRSEDEV